MKLQIRADKEKNNKVLRMKIIQSLLFLLFLAILIFTLSYSFQNPSNNRNWTADQQLQSYAIADGSQMHVYNIRNITYTTVEDYTISYYNKTFDLNNLNSVYFMVEPFAKWEGAAHTFLSFGFGNSTNADAVDSNEYLVISVEIRKEIGEHFSSIKGLLKQYELMYVFGDENDLIKLRSNYRNDSVYLFPIKTEKEKISNLFLDMIERANNLIKSPEFYNTLTSSCTTNIVDHVNKISPKKISFDLRIFAPGYSGKLAYEVGLINTDLSWEEAKKYYKINERAMKYANHSEFSKKIREHDT